MKPLLFIILSIFLVIACTKQSEKDTFKHPATALSLVMPSIHPIPTSLPLQVEEIDLNDTQKQVEVSEGKTAFIESIIKDYYYNECNGDPRQSFVKVNDTYIGTLWAVDTLTSVFYVILQHPSGTLNAKIGFYDNVTKQPLASAVDYNIQAAYHLTDGQLQPNKIKNNLLLHQPVLEVLDYNHDGIHDFKISSLANNGSKNTIKTQIFDVTAKQLEVLK